MNQNDRELDEGIYVVGEGGLEDATEPGDEEYVWEEFAVDSDQDVGGETTTSAPLSEQAQSKAAAAIRRDKVSNGSLAKATTSQQEAIDPVLSRVRRSYIQPPYDPEALANLTQKSGTHAQCVDAKSQGVAGHGFSLSPHPNHIEGDSDGEPAGMEAVRDFYTDRTNTFQLATSEQPATPEDVFENLWWDYEAVGWGCLEFLTTRTGDPTGLVHIPSYRIRKRADAPGYIELDHYGRIKQYYAEVGMKYDTSGDTEESNKRFVDRWTGEISDTRQGVSDAANELLFIQNYNTLTPNYGLPDIVTQIQTIMADLAARRYNARFFENDGVPRFVVSVEGGKLTDRAFENLNERLRKLSQDENSHRGILIEAADAVDLQGNAANDVSVNIQPLTVGEQEDASFIEFRQENEHDIASAHSVPPVVLSRTEGSNYANSKQQRQSFAKNTIRPRQQKLEARIHRTLHSILLNAPGVDIDFELHGGQNRLREAEVTKMRLNAGGVAMTLNEYREELGLPELTTENGEPDPLGNTPMITLQNQDGGEGVESGVPSNLSGDGGADGAGSETAADRLRQAERTYGRSGEYTDGANPYSITSDGD